MKDTIRDALSDALGENPSDMTDKINSVLYAKVEDALKTKKMEVSNRWLNDIQPSETEEE
jgi:hypothetical protein